MTEQEQDELLSIRESALKHAAFSYANAPSSISESILLGEAREFSEFCEKIPRLKDYMKPVWIDGGCENA